jgi:starch synthase
MVSSEASPWAKTGGLADVLGALPGALAAVGHTVGVVIPRYMGARDAPAQRIYDHLWIPVGGRWYDASVWELKAEGVSWFFVDQTELFDRPGLYGFPDDHIRFALLSKAAIEIARRIFPADVIHSHDWPAALVPLYLQMAVDPCFIGTRTVLTIHNLGYQGVFDAGAMAEIGLPRNLFHPEAIEFWGKISFLKGGIVFADKLTTVSPKYAEEIQTQPFGFSLEGILARRHADLSGILNGVDYTRWNPETDSTIPARYSASDLAGKRIDKQDLLLEMGLPDEALDRPLLGIVSRFAGQKGFDLLGVIPHELFGQGVYMVVLGNGEEQIEGMFRWLQSEFPGRVGLRLGYNDALAHRIEAGSDMFIMPSRYEPCGLNQIYSLRYGTVPVVRATGGLDDTVIDPPLDGRVEGATGFKFLDYNGKALMDAILRACRLWEDRDAWTAMMVRGMQKDFSWRASAAEYSRLYAEIASFVVENDSKLLNEA